MENMLVIENVKRSYQIGKEQKIQVLKGIDFTLETGRLCCVFGASGSGKTTLLNLIGTLEKPDEGRIVIAGEDVSNFSRRAAAKFRANRIGFVFQNYQLLPELTILENVAIAGRFAGMSGKTAKAKAAKLLSEVGLGDRLKHRPSELSGGEQQRASIARALINDPVLLLADEPTGNLDSRTGQDVLDLFDRLRRDNPQLTILMITHNRELAARADVVAELADGVLTV